MFQDAGGGLPKAKYKRVTSQPENPYVKLIPDQQICIIPSFTLESGVTLKNVPVAYTTRGKLSPTRTNAMVICHALTGSADVADWWGPLLGGEGKAFDITRFFVICLNSLGSPYGSASPVTNKDGDPELGVYGPEFPLTTIRDDVNIHRLVVEDLGVTQIAAVIGGSMGGMLVLEWAYFGKDFVRCIAPIATSARHSAWGISWGEAQRQCIYCDPNYDDGYYSFELPPVSGLSAARMSALLTYRSRDSFQARFGRNVPDPSRKQTVTGRSAAAVARNGRPQTPLPTGGEVNEHWRIHNHGHRNEAPLTPRPSTPSSSKPETPSLTTTSVAALTVTDPQFHGSTVLEADAVVPDAIIKKVNGRNRPAATHFSAQSYLRYQGQKFVRRFDSNCYIAITRKLDTHDVSRGRASTIQEALAEISQPTLVMGIESDGLFTFAEQEEMAVGIKGSRLRRIESPEGHDAFLLQFEQVNKHLVEFLREMLPDIMGTEGDRTVCEGKDGKTDGFDVKKESTFGEAEGEVEDITAW